VLKKVGEGAFGQVYQVRRRVDNEIYALKKVRMTGMKEKEKENALNEIRILASLTDDYIIKFKEAFYDNPSGYLCIVMEFAPGGDLMRIVNQNLKARTRIKETDIWKALIEITRGLKSLHDKKILHRDLKAANIFIGADGTFKLGDLNVSKVLKKGLAYTQTGTPYYASPEVWQDLPYDMKSDIWSLGCVMYEMAALEPPFKATDLQSLYKKVKAGVFKPIPTSYSSELSEMVNSMLKLRPKDRPSTEEILKHPATQRHSGSISNNNSNDYSEPLLNTIKFNPFNLNALKGRLPKASYENEGGKSHRESLDNLNRERVYSACGTRKAYGTPHHTQNTHHSPSRKSLRRPPRRKSPTSPPPTRPNNRL
jgi:NIMA (never in mitosis gene a)-related kinase